MNPNRNPATRDRGASGSSVDAAKLNGPESKTAPQLKQASHHRPPDAPAAGQCVYDVDGERAGVVRPVLGRWIACNRRGARLGSFETESEAIDAIKTAGGGR